MRRATPPGLSAAGREARSCAVRRLAAGPMWGLTVLSAGGPRALQAAGPAAVGLLSLESLQMPSGPPPGSRGPGRTRESWKRRFRFSAGGGHRTSLGSGTKAGGPQPTRQPKEQVAPGQNHGPGFRVSHLPFRCFCPSNPFVTDSLCSWCAFV